MLWLPHAPPAEDAAPPPGASPAQQVQYWEQYLGLHLGPEAWLQEMGADNAVPFLMYMMKKAYDVQPDDGIIRTLWVIASHGQAGVAALARPLLRHIGTDLSLWRKPMTVIQADCIVALETIKVQQLPVVEEVGNKKAVV